MTASGQVADVAEPLPSATVALARNSAAGPELLLVLRHGRAAFGDSYVFPGGLLEGQDYDVEHRCGGIDAAVANTTLGLDEGGLAYYSAAIRELFEEAGVLLARDAGGRWADAEALAGYREALNSGRESWPAFLDRHDLVLACDALNYFSFWITPREMNRRFSTRFFVAGMPVGQSAKHCGTELTDSRWLTVEAALAESRKAGLQLPHPTRISLETLGRFRTAAEMLAWAARQSESGVTCTEPAIVSVRGKPRVVMPDDDLYPGNPGSE